ncbi:hypothetical protein [Sporomusa malonica]|uniref:Uncharacterized protein n=1 Tax=Sporomusa malonica TaxID=112901 RepID=A0A1W2A5U8_9FIRM|nr:hypothetical protein [Sporomusa malonica]SMC55801.1 hypothetical protein SAMN04488500_10544 [Sporomusa malonica]
MSEDLVSRDFNCCLIHILKRLQGEKDVNIRTVGGFQFEAEGRLARVEDGLALATDVKVFTPGSDEAFRFGNVTINLCAITSVGED